MEVYIFLNFDKLQSQVLLFVWFCHIIIIIKKIGIKKQGLLIKRVNLSAYTRGIEVG